MKDTFDDNNDRKFAEEVIKKEFPCIKEIIPGYNLCINDKNGNQIEIVCEGQYWVDLIGKTYDGKYIGFEIEKSKSYSKIWDKNEDTFTILSDKFFKYFCFKNFDVNLMYLQTNGEFKNLTRKYCIINKTTIKNNLIKNSYETKISKDLNKNCEIFHIKKDDQIIYGKINLENNAPKLIGISKQILEARKTYSKNTWSYSINNEDLNKYEFFKFKKYDEEGNETGEISRLYSISEIKKLIHERNEKRNFSLVYCDEIV